MHEKGRLNDGTELDYAFGLGVGGYRGLKRVSHNGAMMGFRSAFLQFPGERFSAIALCNLADANPGNRVEKVADIYLADRFSRPAPEPEDDEPESAAKASAWKPSAEVLQRLAGTYRSDELAATYHFEQQAASLRFSGIGAIPPMSRRTWLLGTCLPGVYRERNAIRLCGRWLGVRASRRPGAEYPFRSVALIEVSTRASTGQSCSTGWGDAWSRDQIGAPSPVRLPIRQVRSPLSRTSRSPAIAGPTATKVSSRQGWSSACALRSQRKARALEADPRSKTPSPTPRAQSGTARPCATSLNNRRRAGPPAQRYRRVRQARPTGCRWGRSGCGSSCQPSPPTCRLANRGPPRAR